MTTEDSPPVQRVSLYTSDGAGTATVVAAANPVPSAPVVAGAVVSASNPLPVEEGAPVAADILNGFLSYAATQAATTLLTVAAGRTWVGEIGASCSVGVDAASTTAGKAQATFTTAGTGVTPAAGTIFRVEAKAGANSATGTVGSQGAQYGSMPLVVIAPVGNAVQVQIATTQAGTSSEVHAWASGRLV